MRSFWIFETTEHQRAAKHGLETSHTWDSRGNYGFVCIPQNDENVRNHMIPKERERNNVNRRKSGESIQSGLPHQCGGRRDYEDKLDPFL